MNGLPSDNPLTPWISLASQLANQNQEKSNQPDASMPLGLVNAQAAGFPALLTYDGITSQFNPSISGMMGVDPMTTLATAPTLPNSTNISQATVTESTSSQTTGPKPIDTDNKVKKRSRRTLACDDCRRRKVRCDGNRPSCTSCIRHGTTCHYQESAKKRGPKPGYIEKLERRLNLMEKMLMPLSNVREESPSAMLLQQSPQSRLTRSRSSTIDMMSMGPYTNGLDWLLQTSNMTNTTTIPGPSQTTPTSVMLDTIIKPTATGKSADEVLNMYPDPLSMNEPNANNLTKTIPIRFINLNGKLSNIPQTAPSGNFMSSSCGQLPFDLMCTEFNGCMSGTLPAEANSPELRDHLIESFFTYTSPYFNFIHRDNFLKKIREGTVSQSLLCAVMALGVRYSPLSSVRNDPNLRGGMVYAHRAQHLMRAAILTPDMSFVATLHLLGIYFQACGDMARSWMAMNTSLRMAQGIRLHILDDKDNTDFFSVPRTNDWADMEEKRRLWWILFGTDRIIGMASGHPMSIDELDCNVDLPSNDIAWFSGQSPGVENAVANAYGDIGSLHALSSRPGYVETRVMVSIITTVGRIARYVNRPRRRYTRGELTGPPDEEFVKLEQELQAIMNEVRASIKTQDGITDDPTWPPTNLHQDQILDRLKAREESIQASCYVMCHVGCIYLYRSVLDSEPGECKYQAKTPFTKKCLRQAQISSDSICAIVARLRTEHYGFLCTPMVLAIVAAACMQLHTAASGDLGSSAVVAATQKLTTFINTLVHIESRWALAGLARGMTMEILRFIKSKQPGADAVALSPADQEMWQHIRLPVKSSTAELIRLWEYAVQREFKTLVDEQASYQNVDLLQPFDTAMNFNGITGSNGSESPDSRSHSDTPKMEDDDAFSLTDASMSTNTAPLHASPTAESFYPNTAMASAWSRPGSFSDDDNAS